MAVSRFFLLLGVLGLVVGCSPATHRAPGPGPAGPGASRAAQAFLDAWQRSLTTSWSVEESVRRTTRVGRTITFSAHRAQRPPDHLETGLGTVDQRAGDRTVACGAGAGGSLACSPAIAAPPYAKVIADQLATLRMYVAGRTALYAVAQLGGCFELRLRLASYPVPPYGRMATFCFDPTTGAPAGSVIARDEGTDRMVVVDAHSPATDADLALPDAGQLAVIGAQAHRAVSGG